MHNNVQSQVGLFNNKKNAIPCLMSLKGHKIKRNLAFLNHQQWKKLNTQVYSIL